VPEETDLWHALLSAGDGAATEAEYEHGYRREIRTDLQRYVTFELASERYAIVIDRIVEISRRFATTRVPRTCNFVLGIGNVRGQVMPVIDLVARLALGHAGDDRHSRTLIAEHAGELHGLVVDRVHDVVSIAPEDLEDAPGGLGRTRADFIAALGRVDGAIVIVLDLDAVLDPHEFVLARFRREEAET
jgi:purine-binding chemotaxis protein CheW